MKPIRDTWLLFTRNVATTLRNPAWVIIGLFQPICYLLLFAPLLNRIAAVPGFPAGGALNVFTPGLLVMQAMFGAVFVGYGLLADLRAGVIERFRVTPVSRLALLLGRALRDIVVLLAQAILLVLAAWPLGLRADRTGIVITLGLLVVMGFLLTSCSYALALVLKSENALASTLQFFITPLLLLSGIILPLTLAPPSIRTVAAFNPLAHAVDAARALFNGNLGDAAVLRGFATITVLAALAFTWAARSLRQATA